MTALDDAKALADIHRTPWRPTGWGDYPAAHIAQRLADAIDRGELILRTGEPDD